jgi:glycosyltransferase involved in cell wall biosynthesis
LAITSAAHPATAHSSTAHSSADHSSEPVGLFLMINTFETGGSERQCALLAQNASASKFKVQVGCVNPRGPLAAQFGEFTQFPLGGSLFGWRSMRSRFALARHLRKNSVQVAHAFDFYTNLTLIPAARFARVPVVIGSHRQLGDLLTPAQFRAQAAAFRWCDAVVCNSQAGADRLAAAGVAREKLVVIGNAMPGAVFEAATPALPRPANVLRVTMVARMNAHYKNHAGFLRIAAEVHKHVPQAEFLLVGDGPLRGEIEQQCAALGLGERVSFLGDRRDIPAILASTNVAVLTSDSEGLSNVILEAMAAGVPVIAYAVGGNPELVNADRGALIPAGNEGEFASAICRALSDHSLRREQGRNARRFAEENFGLGRVCRQYENLYLNLLDRKGRRRPTV